MRRETSMVVLLLHSLLISGLCSCGTTATIQTTPAAPTIRRFIYAHYFNPFIYGEAPVVTGSEHWDTWTQHEFDPPDWWPEAFAPDSDAGQVAIEQDFEWGQAAGLDAFGLIVLFNAPTWPAYETSYLNNVASVASRSGLKILPDIWPEQQAFDSPDPQIASANALRYGQFVKQWMDANPGAFVWLNNKPVINLGASLVEDANVVPATFMHFFDPWGGPGNCYIIADIGNAANAAAWGPYVNAFSGWPSEGGWDPSLAVITTQLAQLASRFSRDLSWPIFPSYFETHYPWPSPRAMGEYLGASSYIDNWITALNNGSKFIQLETWDDFTEDSALTNTNLRGTSLIDLTSYFAAWAHGGVQPPVTTERVFLFHHRQLTTTTYSAATELAVSPEWATKTPTTDYIEVVTLLQTAATLTVSAGGDSWTKEVPRGLHEWLIYKPSIISAPVNVPSNQFAPAYVQAGSYPTGTSRRDVTIASAPFSPGTPEVIVTRGASIVLTGISRVGWQASARWQDMTMVGDEWIIP